jgi:hypothetical protein
MSLIGARAALALRKSLLPFSRSLREQRSNQTLITTTAGTKAAIALAAVICSLVLAAPSLAQNVNWGAKSALLELEMSEQQVMNAVGYRPNKVEMQTCGQQTKDGPWTCKKHTYGVTGNSLTVYFSRADGTWRAANWSVFP